MLIDTAHPIHAGKVGWIRQIALFDDFELLVMIEVQGQSGFIQLPFFAGEFTRRKTTPIQRERDELALLELAA
ncbi:MAG TPA: hypothetical protein VIE69_06920 [Methylophilaceae bacterium]